MWLIPLELEGVCPERKLAATVLIVALRDALGLIGTKDHNQSATVLQAEAAAWIATDSPDLEWWTAAAGVTPKVLRTYLSFCGNELRTRPSESWTYARRVEPQESDRTARRGRRGRRRKRDEAIGL